MTDFERLAHQQPAHVYRDVEAEIVKQNGGYTRSEFAAALNDALGLPPPPKQTVAGKGYVYRKYVDGLPTQETSPQHSPRRGQEVWILERLP
jgi:hypothetical protein